MQQIPNTQVHLSEFLQANNIIFFSFLININIIYYIVLKKIFHKIKLKTDDNSMHT